MWVRQKQKISTTCPSLHHSKHPGSCLPKFYSSWAYFVFVFKNHIWMPSTIAIIANSEGYIKQFMQQQCCVSWIEETNPTGRIWPCQIPQEKIPALGTADVELPNNNVIKSHLSCSKCQVLQKPVWYFS